MIHPSAIIHEDAQLAEGVEIGPYVVIGKHVSIGTGTTIGPHTVIGDWTEIGENNQIYHMASVGPASQDLKYRGEECWTRIGNNNIIREFATIHRGTVTGISETTIGDGNLFMAYSHVAHDCRIGNGVIMANAATLAGHVTVEDFVGIGGLVAIHQFVTIATNSYIGGGTLIGQDILPYMVVTAGKTDRDASLRGLNLVGLKRRGFSDETISNLKKAYKTLFMSGLKTQDAVAKIQETISGCPEVDYLLTCIARAERGFCRG